MTQPPASDSQLPPAALQENNSATKSVKNIALPQSPVYRHPNFDPSQTPIDPDRPLTDIPDPVPSSNDQLRRLYGQNDGAIHCVNQKAVMAVASKWSLIESNELSEHLSLLLAAELIRLPDSFYASRCSPPLLPSLDQMPLLDLQDINAVLRLWPNLTRFGITTSDQMPHQSTNYQTKSSEALSNDHRGCAATAADFDTDELLNSDYADDWEVILYPERFDYGEGSLGTDIMACSVAAFVLQESPTRQTINYRYSAQDICQNLRSYVLSQLRLSPEKRQLYRQIRIFPGHIIVAANYLGWSIEVSPTGACFFNVSSRCSLLTRYPNLNEYYINGWRD